MMKALPVVPAHEVRWRVSDAVLVLLGAQLLSILWAGTVIGIAYGSEPIPDSPSAAIGVLANVGLWLGYGFGPYLMARHKGAGPVADYGARITAGDVPLGVVIGVLLQLAVLPILYWPLLRFVDGDPSEAARSLVQSIEGNVDRLLFTLSVAVVAPIVEEFFYRGLLLRALQHRFGPVVAVIISAAVFALVHRQPLSLPGLFVFGVVAAVVTLRSGRLGPAIALHVAFNATTLVVLGLEA